MAERIVLGILSVFTRIAFAEYAFERQGAGQAHVNAKSRYRGILTNVAPTECLIDLAQDEGMPVSKVIYLCTEKAKNELRDLSEANDLSIVGQKTAEQYFRETITAYYGASEGALQGGPKDARDDSFFVRIDYDEANPEKSLQAILDAIGTDDVLVDVDNTGGPRDAAVLATIAIQVIKSRYSLPGANTGARTGLGNTTYALLGSRDNPLGKITLQGRTYDLIDLINAVEAFTRYGKAQPLCEFFSKDNGGHPSSPKLVELLEAMKEFSDDLALCNVWDMPAQVQGIYRLMDELRTSNTLKKRRWQFAQDALDRLDSFEGSRIKSADKAQLLGIPCAANACDSAIDRKLSDLQLTSVMKKYLRSCEKKKDLRQWLLSLQENSVLRRAEMLFMSLLDGIEHDFIRDVGNRPSERQKAEQTIGLIRWCVSRQLLQQALSLSYEFYPRCMGQLGYVSWGTEPLAVSRNGRPLYGKLLYRKEGEEMVGRIEQLAYYRTNVADAIDITKREQCVRSRCFNLTNFPRPEDEYKTRMCSVLFPTEIANDAYIKIDRCDEPQIRAMLIWYPILTSLRNETNHANNNAYLRKRNSNQQVFKQVISNAEEVECTFDRLKTIEALSADINKALDALEGKVVLQLKDVIPHCGDSASRSPRVRSTAAAQINAANGLNRVECNASPNEIETLLKGPECRYIALGTSSSWKPLIERLQKDNKFQIEWVLRVKSKNVSDTASIPLTQNQAPFRIQQYAHVRDSIAANAEEGTLVTSEMLRQIDADLAMKRLKPLFSAIRTGGINHPFYKLAQIYPGNFDAIRCVRLR